MEANFEVRAIADQVAEAHQLAVELCPHHPPDPRHERLLDLLFTAEQAIERLAERLRLGEYRP
jgi:hypothetical protein